MTTLLPSNVALIDVDDENLPPAPPPPSSELVSMFRINSQESLLRARSLTNLSSSNSNISNISSNSNNNNNNRNSGIEGDVEDEDGDDNDTTNNTSNNNNNNNNNNTNKSPAITTAGDNDDDDDDDDDDDPVAIAARKRRMNAKANKLLGVTDPSSSGKLNKFFGSEISSANSSPTSSNNNNNSNHASPTSNPSLSKSFSASKDVKAKIAKPSSRHTAFFRSKAQSVNEDSDVSGGNGNSGSGGNSSPETERRPSLLTKAATRANLFDNAVKNSSTSVYPTDHPNHNNNNNNHTSSNTSGNESPRTPNDADSEDADDLSNASPLSDASLQRRRSKTSKFFGEDVLNPHSNATASSSAPPMLRNTFSSSTSSLNTITRRKFSKVTDENNSPDKTNMNLAPGEDVQFKRRSKLDQFFGDSPDGSPNSNNSNNNNNNNNSNNNTKTPTRPNQSQRNFDEMHLLRQHSKKLTKFFGDVQMNEGAGVSPPTMRMSLIAPRFSVSTQSLFSNNNNNNNNNNNGTNSNSNAINNSHSPLASSQSAMPPATKLNKFFGEDVKDATKSPFLERAKDEHDIKFKFPQTTETPVILGGTIARLVERITYDLYPDTSLQATLLQTYGMFSTADALFNAFMERYNTPVTPRDSSKSAEELQKIIRFKVLTTILTWVDRRKLADDKRLSAYFCNPKNMENKMVMETDLRVTDEPPFAFQAFEESSLLLLSKIRSFLESVVASNSNGNELSATATRILTLMNTQYNFNFKVEKLQSNATPSGDIVNKLYYVGGDPEEDEKTRKKSKRVQQRTRVFAEQLCLIDFENFAAIEMEECLNKNWSSKPYLAPNITHMIDWFNTVSNWVVETILAHDSVEQRALVVEDFIYIANHIKSLNNFNGILQIMSGLANAAVDRLKKTWAKVDKAAMAVFLELKTFVDHSNNNKSLRDALQNVEPPCVPYLGIYLSDLTFIDDGNPSFLSTETKEKVSTPILSDNGEKLINVSKFQLISKVLQNIQQYQIRPYNIAKLPMMYDYLKGIVNSMSPDDAYKASLRVEPRAGTPGAAATVSRATAASTTKLIATTVPTPSSAPAVSAEAENQKSLLNSSSASTTAGSTGVNKTVAALSIGSIPERRRRSMSDSSIANVDLDAVAQAAATVAVTKEKETQEGRDSKTWKVWTWGRNKQLTNTNRSGSITNLAGDSNDPTGSSETSPVLVNNNNNNNNKKSSRRPISALFPTPSSSSLSSTSSPSFGTPSGIEPSISGSSLASTSTSTSNSTDTDSSVSSSPKAVHKALAAVNSNDSLDSVRSRRLSDYSGVNVNTVPANLSDNESSSSKTSLGSARGARRGILSSSKESLASTGTYDESKNIIEDLEYALQTMAAEIRMLKQFGTDEASKELLQATQMDYLNIKLQLQSLREPSGKIQFSMRRPKSEADLLSTIDAFVSNNNVPAPVITTPTSRDSISSQISLSFSNSFSLATSVALQTPAFSGRGGFNSANDKAVALATVTESSKQIQVEEASFYNWHEDESSV